MFAPSNKSSVVVACSFVLDKFIYTDRDSADINKSNKIWVQLMVLIARRVKKEIEALQLPTILTVTGFNMFNNPTSVIQ
jgi:hypothetical protein